MKKNNQRKCERLSAGQISKVNSCSDSNWDASRWLCEWSVTDWIWGYSICITKGQSGFHISSWFSLWMHGAVLAVSNFPSKWVCSPLWEAKSIKQLLWHLENPFTMIETIQLKPLQSVFSFSSASTSHIWFFPIHWKEKQSPYQYKKMTSTLLCKQSIESLVHAWGCKSDSKVLSTWNSGCIATARLIQQGTDSVITFFFFLFWQAFPLAQRHDFIIGSGLVADSLQTACFQSQIIRKLKLLVWHTVFPVFNLFSPRKKSTTFSKVDQLKLSFSWIWYCHAKK